MRYIQNADRMSGHSESFSLFLKFNLTTASHVLHDIVWQRNKKSWRIKDNTSNIENPMWRFWTRRLFLLSGFCMRDTNMLSPPSVWEHSPLNASILTRYCGLVQNVPGEHKTVKTESDGEQLRLITQYKSGHSGTDIMRCRSCFTF